MRPQLAATASAHPRTDPVGHPVGNPTGDPGVQIDGAVPAVSGGGAGRFLIGDADHEFSPIGGGNVAVHGEFKNNVVGRVAHFHLHDIKGSATGGDPRINIFGGIADRGQLRLRAKSKKGSNAENRT